ncbi:thiamine pyrophosphate-binding protein [Streptomyces lunaelactis]|uniref:thiamine pyrophosphate-binding protein n=1 Tax=Streptomyces lunaelactis TaxID=1535768 RepID=UPI0015846E8D|nr:thiamine pyrophosphate-binding protein [Streptomyces lunaelactis]NUK49171.1 thiamine pyrophosphate-binding protein [Streptomyces lunaelactis]NUK62922.1 thiamine pyrophosphate-binding protein [Streptomyces lunaelactis]
MSGVPAAWQQAADCLADAGCETVFGLPTDEPGLLDAADAHPELRAVGVRAHRAGACMAIGHALVTGRPVVLALGAGPPFGDAVTALVEADSVCAPVVVVTTRIPADGLGRGGFQDVDQVALAAAFTTTYLRVQDPGALTWALRRAVHMSLNGRPGVTVVEVAHEVTEAAIPADAPSGNGPVRRMLSVPEESELRRAAAILAGAERPLLLLGGGARASGAGPAALALAERWGAPVMTTAAGRGTVPEDHPLVCGSVGLYATPPLDTVQCGADTVLAVGSRLEETARMGWDTLESVRLVQIDCDPAAFGGGVVEPAAALLGDGAATVSRLAALLPERSREAADWLETAAHARRAACLSWTAEGDRAGSPARTALHALAEIFPDATTVHDNGMNDIWSYHWPVHRLGPRARTVVPGEQTMLGFGTAAAPGVALASEGRPTVVVCGDGGVEMGLDALPTAAELGLGLVLLVFDNQGYGWPRLLRHGLAAPTGLTRFARPLPVDDVVRGLGGQAESPDGADAVPAALRRARETAESGRIALVRITVPDDDVPPGIRRLFLTGGDGAGDET